MQPIRETNFSLNFAAGMSPWWLLPALVLTVVAVWLLYRRQLADVPATRGLLLLLLRAAMMALIVSLIFRPNLVMREIITWPGRIVLMLDDSGSMGVWDTGYSDAQALRLARQLDTELQPRQAHDNAERLGRAIDELRKYEQLSRLGDRDDNAFWVQTEAVQQRLTEMLTQSGSAATALDLSALFTGSQHAGSASFDLACEQLAKLVESSQAAQIAEDAAQLPANQVLAEAAQRLRSLPRSELVAEYLAKTVTAVPGLFTEFRLLSGGEWRPGKVIEAKARTDIVAALNSAIDEDNPFPIAALAVITDGCDHSAQTPDQLLQRLSRRELPLFTIGVGAGEPRDLAVTHVRAPPFSVVGRALPIEVVLKTAVGEPLASKVRVRLDQADVAVSELQAGREATTMVKLEVKPEEPGVHRYTVDIAPVSGEVVPTRNNARDVVVDVREQPLRVLLLDWLPTWETRFLLNILQRLDYIELNAIIGVAQPQATVTRGAQRGSWPENYAALQTYDLVFIGELPAGTLTAAESADLERWVTEHGGTLCRLNHSSELRPEQLVLTAAGVAQPLTRSLAEAVAGRSPRCDALLWDTALDQPVISAVFAGAGKRVDLSAGEFWRWLNPQHLSAHLDLYFQLVTWSQHALADEASGLQLDCRTALDTSVLAVGTTAGETVDAIRDGNVISTLTAAAPLVQFSNLGPGRVQFRISGRETLSPPIELVADDPELDFLALNEDYCRLLAESTGGICVGLADLERVMSRIEPKARVERHERVWRLWDSRAVFALIVLLLTGEWIWRKFEGLV